MMKISEEISVTVKAVKYSSCGKYLAFGWREKLTIIINTSMEVVAECVCSNKIDAIDWSADSELILCVSQSKGSVEVFSLGSSRWICTVREGLAGLDSASWSPASHHIITTVRFAARLTLWSLAGRSIAFIETPLMRRNDALSFGSDGRYLAVITGNAELYEISIFSTSSWIVARRIPCTNRINVPSPPLWSPHGCEIAIWETVESRNSILEIYSMEEEKILGTFISGERKRRVFSGISSVIWCSNGQFLLIGCYDECIYVISYITWKVIHVFQHERIIHDDKCLVFHDVFTTGKSALKILKDRPIVITSVEHSTHLKTFHKPGVKNISISKNGIYMASQSTAMPAVVWIWNLKIRSLVNVLILKNEVTDLKWSSSKSNLLVCSKSQYVYIYSPNKPFKLEFKRCARENKLCISQGCWRPLAKDHVETLLIFNTSSSMRIISDLDIDK